MTKHIHKPPQSLDSGELGPPPPCADWSEVTFQQWCSMHLDVKKSTNTKRVHVDLLFPPKEGVPTEGDANLFGRAVIAGRPPSAGRQALSFYQQFGGQQRAEMYDFLNYIISHGDTVSAETTSIIQRCLDSRIRCSKQPPADPEGKAPVWGHHETFYMGAW